MRTLCIIALAAGLAGCSYFTPPEIGTSSIEGTHWSTHHADSAADIVDYRLIRDSDGMVLGEFDFIDYDSPGHYKLYADCSHGFAAAEFEELPRAKKWVEDTCEH